MYVTGCSRRGFILSSAAFAASAMPPLRALAGAAGEKPRLTLGIVSDIHLNRLYEAEHGTESADDFRKALTAFRDAGVDGVVIPGDMASLGLRCDLDAVASVWYEVFPGDRLPDGRKVEKLFVTGNHDCDGPAYAKSDKKIIAAYPDPKVRMANCLSSDYARHWRECFNEEFSPVWMKRVKGYVFVGAHWTSYRATPDGACINEALGTFFAERAGELPKDRPFFFIQHPHPKDTCYGPRAWGHDDGTVTKALSAFPNAVALTGHSHYSLADDQSVWQGAFTSIGCGSLACTERPLAWDGQGDENGDTPKGDAKKKLLAPHVQYRNVQGMIMRVYDDRLVIERRRFDESARLGPDWIVPLPAGSADFTAKRHLDVPRFAASAAVAVETGDALDRGGVPRRVVTAVFPQAAEGPRALRYDVALVAADGRELARKTVIEDGFHRAPDPRRMNRCPFDRDTLPATGGWRFAVYPRNAWGRAGSPVFSTMQTGR